MARMRIHNADLTEKLNNLGYVLQRSNNCRLLAQLNHGSGRRTEDKIYLFHSNHRGDSDTERWRDQTQTSRSVIGIITAFYPFRSESGHFFGRVP